MSADFWAGYVSGAFGILVGNPLDLIKTRLQADPTSLGRAVTSKSHNGQLVWAKQFERWSTLARGAAAPVLGCGALNALLFVTYNRGLSLLNTGRLSQVPENPSAWSVWTAGAFSGLAIFLVSAPTELVKCRAQVSHPPLSSLDVVRELWKHGGVRGLYLGGGVTSMRDAIGYGFYFWSYHLSKQAIMQEDESSNQQAVKVLLCGGLAGIMTWASIFPLDVVKTRVQTWGIGPPFAVSPRLRSLQRDERAAAIKNSIFARSSAMQVARDAYRTEGVAVFFRGLGICSARAFVVNAVQWAIYEWMMNQLAY